MERCISIALVRDVRFVYKYKYKIFLLKNMEGIERSKKTVGPFSQKHDAIATRLCLVCIKVRANVNMPGEYT